jgi:hypothetical protein
MGALVWLLFAAQAAGAADPLAWFPLEVGHRWVYDCVMRSGHADHPDVYHWTATITVAEHIPTAEGLVILRSVGIEGQPNPAEGWPRDSLTLLVRDACIYPLYPEAWDNQNRAFTPGFADYIREISPMFCFPLRAGATWNGTGDWTWTVEGFGPGTHGPQDVAASAFRLMSPQSGSTEYVWFERGVGPVAWWSWHNGTYTEGTEKLRR